MLTGYCLPSLSAPPTALTTTSRPFDADTTDVASSTSPTLTVRLSWSLVTLAEFRTTAVTSWPRVKVRPRCGFRLFRWPRTLRSLTFLLLRWLAFVLFRLLRSADR